MTDPHLLSQYNYDEFVPEKFQRWLNFQASPPMGEPAPDFSLWHNGFLETKLLFETLRVRMSRSHNIPNCFPP